MSLHDDTTSVLAAWPAPSTDQAALRDEYLAHLSSRPDAMSRGCHPDHLTASALVMSADGTRVALHLHRRLGMWLQMGGHCEPGDDTLLAAALREAIEESGIADLDVDPVPVLLSRHEVPCGPVRPAHHLDVQFLAVAPDGAELARSDESDDLAWFAVDALPPSADASVRELVAAALLRVG